MFPFVVSKAMTVSKDLANVNERSETLATFSMVRALNKRQKQANVYAITKRLEKNTSLFSWKSIVICCEYN